MRHSILLLGLALALASGCARSHARPSDPFDPDSVTIDIDTGPIEIDAGGWSPGDGGWIDIDAGPPIETDAGDPDAGPFQGTGLAAVSCQGFDFPQRPLECQAPGRLYVHCPDPDHYRDDDGVCHTAPEACCRADECIASAAGMIPSGHFVRNFLWDNGHCAGNDCCLDCAFSVDDGEPIVESRCRSGLMRCEITEDGRDLPGESCLLATGHCRCL